MGKRSASIKKKPAPQPRKGAGAPPNAAIAAMSAQTKAQLIAKLIMDGKTDSPFFQQLVDASNDDVTTEAGGAISNDSESSIAADGTDDDVDGDDEDDEEENEEEEEELEDQDDDEDEGEWAAREAQLKEKKAKKLENTIHGVGEYKIKADQITGNDVLCGRGKAAMKNPGNLQLRRIVSRKLGSFSKSNSNEKKALYQEVLDLVLMEGGRFLEKHPSKDSYRRITLQSALSKVHKTFHSLRLMDTPGRFCKVEGCTKRRITGGVCMAHGGTQKRKQCNEAGCGNVVVKAGLCFRHGREHGV